MSNIVNDILEEGTFGERALTEAEELSLLISRLKHPPKKPVGISLTLNPYQSQFLLSPERGFQESLYSGSVGGGKSLTLSLALLRYVEIPNTPVLLCRKTLQDLKKSTMVTLLKPENQPDGSVRPPLLPASAIKSWNKMDGIITLHNGSSIICIGAQDPERFGSICASASFIEEASEFSPEMYRTVAQRTRVPCKLPNVLFSCTNPKSQSHFLYERFFIDNDPTRQQITVSAYSNRHLSKKYIQQLEKLPPKERDRMLLGLWTSDDKQVFTHFDRQHIKPCPEIGAYERYILSQDYGGGSGGSAMHLLGVIGDKIYCIKEFYAMGPSHSEVLRWMEPFRAITHSQIVYDSANAALKNDMEARSWTCIKCLKDIEGCISVVNSGFYDNRLFVDPSCTNLIKQLNEVSRDSNGSINKVKGWDAIDSFRYGVVELMKKPEVKTRILTGIALRR